MKTRRSRFLASLIAMTIGSGIGQAQSNVTEEWSALMPRAGDHTSMWWAEGFPGVVEGAPWLRGIETGNYAFVLNTESLQIPHFGPLSKDTDWRTLPSADLALNLTVDGKTYRCSAGGQWTRHTGPRLIESGRHFQRADVTDLVFTAEDGTRLNVDARFETAAWPDRLGMILAARPGLLPISAGNTSFGRVRGGFGLVGTNYFEIPAQPEWDPANFTLEFWAFVPADFKASETSPWLVCKNRNEVADGNYGIMIRHDGMPQARLNLGGGNENAFVLEPESKSSVLQTEAWNHLAISYDGNTLRLYMNGKMAGEKQIGRPRTPVPGAIAFGRRQDNSGDGYRFRGVIDEIRLYDRSLSLEELRLHYVKPEMERPALKPVGAWTFLDEGTASMTKLSEEWSEAALEISLTNGKETLTSRWDLPENQTWSASDWQETAIAFDPVSFELVESKNLITVDASEIPTGAARPVVYEPSVGWHRINLDGIEPIPPAGVDAPSNDAIERVRLVLSNPTANEEIARLMFEKTARGLRQRIGTPITGISAILRDPSGNPTGIPVQLSKNWHVDPKAGTYAGQWFHGISQVRLPPGSTTELEFTIAYGHWGGVPAASHAQLSLIGWGSNQLWDQSALGSWGESICYEPDQVQRECTIMDVRPAMVRSMNSGKPWGWTTNVGGGDVFRLFDPAGERIPHSAMRTTYHRQGPCLTEVTYAGHLGKGITHSNTVSLARTDDLVRGICRLRLDVNEATDFSRFVLFQIAADTYSTTREKRMAFGNENGLTQEWKTQWGGDTYRAAPIEATGRIPWVSLHEAEAPNDDDSGALANRGIVIRSWKARLGCSEIASPWLAEHGLAFYRTETSTLDLVPPPGVTRLEPGDFIEATIELLIMPQFAADYYGPNAALRAALEKDENTWRMIHREAVGNDRRVEMTTGALERTVPDIRIQTTDNIADFTLTGGLGYVPITFMGLTLNQNYLLKIDGEPVDQSIHGNDFWQTDYDPETRRWSRTYNVPIADKRPRSIHFGPKP